MAGTELPWLELLVVFSVKTAGGAEGLQIVVDFRLRHGETVENDACVVEEKLRQRVVVVRKDDDPFDSGGDQCLGAVRARHVRDIIRSARKADAMLRRLADGVDLRMVRADAVVVDDHAAVFVAMRRARQGAVVTCCQDVFILYKHAAAVHARAGGAFGGEHGEFEEIFVP